MVHGHDRFAFQQAKEIFVNQDNHCLELKSAEVIKRMIFNTCGFDTVNQVVQKEILKWVLYAFEQYLSEPQSGCIAQSDTSFQPKASFSLTNSSFRSAVR